MSMIEMIKNKARANVKRIVLPEGEEPRTIAAAGIVNAEGLARPVLLGKPEAIRDAALKLGVDLRGIEIEDPADSAKAMSVSFTSSRLPPKAARHIAVPAASFTAGWTSHPAPRAAAAA